jgi:serine phosphatase RsbU (regulator of sigma subunit)
MTQQLKKTVFFACLMIALSASAQHRKNDSLWAVYHNTATADSSRLQAMNFIAQSFRSNKPDTAILLAGEELALARKTGHTAYAAKAYVTMAIASKNKSDYGKAIEYNHAAIEVYESIHDKKGMGICYNNLGNIFKHEANYPKALEFILRSLKLREEAGDKPGEAYCYVNIGVIYALQLNFPKALDYQFKALKIFEKEKIADGIGTCYDNLAGFYSNTGEYSKAMVYFNKALVVEKAINDVQGVGLCYEGLGEVSKKLKDYPRALNYYQEDLAIMKKIGNKQSAAVSFGNMSELYLNQGMYDKAIQYSDSVLQITGKISAIDQERLAYGALSEAYAHKSKFKEAYDYHVRFKKLTDSIFSNENSKQLGDLKTRFEVEKKETELEGKAKAEQEKMQAIARIEKKKQQFIIGAFIAGLTLILIFVFFIVNRLRITSKQKRIIEKQKAIVEKQKQETEHQKLLVEAHQKEIIDSINYAKRLQMAILPTTETVREHLPDSFIFYQPKDIVSGDFYWIEHLDDTTFIAAADSTGHGVPGSMVSILCSNALNRAVKEFRLRNTGEILNKTRELVLETFAKSSSDVKDGMDISLLAIHKAKQTLFWSGANNSLWYVVEGKLNEIKGDKQPIGKTENAKPFTCHTVPYQAGSIFYLYTDGYADQFGGSKGKKFKYRQLQEYVLANSSRPMEEQKQLLGEEFENWKGNLEQVDDVTIIGLKI